MIIGFDCFNFEVRQGYVVKNGESEADIEAIKALCGKPSQLILLKTREELDKVPVNYLLSIYKFFTGKTLKYDKVDGDKKALRESVRQVFDVSKLTVVESKPQTNPKQETDMATKTKSKAKAAAKKAAPKAAKKAAAKNGEAKRGRAHKFGPEAKLHAKHKENGFRGARGKAYQIILDNAGITVEKFVAKGGTMADLLKFTSPEIAPLYDAVRVVGN